MPPPRPPHKPTASKALRFGRRRIQQNLVNDRGELVRRERPLHTVLERPVPHKAQRRQATDGKSRRQLWLRLGVNLEDAQATFVTSSQLV